MSRFIDFIDLLNSVEPTDADTRGLDVAKDCLVSFLGHPKTPLLVFMFQSLERSEQQKIISDFKKAGFPINSTSVDDDVDLDDSDSELPTLPDEDEGTSKLSAIVEVTPDADTGVLDVAKDCLLSFLGHPKTLSLVGKFQSLKRNEQQKISSDLKKVGFPIHPSSVDDDVDVFADVDAADSDSELPTLLDVDERTSKLSAIGISIGELIEQYLAALEKMKHFNTTTHCNDDPSEVAMVTRLFEDASMRSIHYRGTCVVFIIYNNGIMLASDTRAETMDGKVEDWEKLFIVNDQQVLAASGVVVPRMFDKYIEFHKRENCNVEKGAEEITRLWEKYVIEDEMELKEKSELVNHESQLRNAEYLLCAIEHGQPCVYRMYHQYDEDTEKGEFCCEKFTETFHSMGCGAEYADSYLRPREDENSAFKTCLYAICEAIRKDDDCGGMVMAINIKESGPYPMGALEHHHVQDFIAKHLPSTP